MKIKLQQKFASRVTGEVIKVTKIEMRMGDKSSKFDVCRVCDVVAGKAVLKTARLMYSDSIRRRYTEV
jgi:hypothetical protein